MSEEIDYKKLYEQELAKKEEAEYKLSRYRIPSELRGFYEYNRIINAQVDILAEFDLKAEIKMAASKDDKYYDRVETIIEKLPLHLGKLNTLKGELNLTGNEQKDKENVPFIESVATKRD